MAHWEAPGLRLDKWLWAARFFKTRSLAAQLCRAGRIRVNGAVVSKAHAGVRPGDVLTFPQASRVRIIRVVALSEVRGPAPVAQQLYEDLSPPAEAGTKKPDGRTQPVAVREAGAGRPTKRERRKTDRLKGPE